MAVTSFAALGLDFIMFASGRICGVLLVFFTVKRSPIKIDKNGFVDFHKINR